MDLSWLSISNVILFLLMMVRITGLLLTVPFFSDTTVPPQLQTGLAFALSLILFPLYAGHSHLELHDLWQFMWVATQEFAIGALLGFITSMVFAGIQMAGNQVSTQMGLNMANMVDPITHEPSGLMGQIYFILAVVLFFSFNIHHSLIIAVVKSFELLPLAGGITHFNLLTGRLMAMGADLFVVSVTLIFPILGIMLVNEVALAFTAKLMPQMNIFMVALPLKIGLGLLLMSMVLPFTAEALGNQFEILTKHLFVFFQA